MFKTKTRLERHLKKHMRVRTKLAGSAERPRLCVFRSLKHIYVQIIDDSTGRTLISASTLDKEIRAEAGGNNKEMAKKGGQLAAKRALEKGIGTVVFDRGGYLYHGRVKSLADSAREAGLKF
jgi:large subunit ribosomal protein L18